MMGKLRSELERSFDHPAGQIVATARLALACFALLAIWLDPSQPDRYPPLTYSVLAAYVLHALLMMVIDKPFIGAIHVAAHAIDVLITGLLIYLTQGPTSPFFVLTTFVMFSSVIKWGSVGALITAAALVSIQLFVTVLDGITEIDRFIMRSGYLIVGGCLFAYYGSYRDRLETRLARLAEWPGDDFLHDVTAIDYLLAHASEILGCNRIVLACEIEGGPHLFVSTWSKGKRTLTNTHGPDEFGPLVEGKISNLAFAVQSNATPAAITQDGIQSLAHSPIDQKFAATYGLSGPLVSASFDNADARGRVFCVGPKPLKDHLLSLIQIVANRVGNRIQHHQIRLRLQEAALVQERTRLANDLHDSTMQTMTAASLQLKKIALNERGPASRDQLDEVRLQIANQQHEIRSMLEMLQESPNSEPVELGQAMRRTLSRIEQIWGCTTSVRVDPQPTKVPRNIQQQLHLVLLEAAANACRHGKAKSINVTARSFAERLTLEIHNDGAIEPVSRAPHGGAPSGPIEPEAIRRRVADLGGTVSLSGGGSGVLLKISIPLL